MKRSFPVLFGLLLAIISSAPPAANATKPADKIVMTLRTPVMYNDSDFPAWVTLKDMQTGKSDSGWVNKDIHGLRWGRHLTGGTYEVRYEFKTADENTTLCDTRARYDGPKVAKNGPFIHGHYKNGHCSIDVR